MQIKKAQMRVAVLKPSGGVGHTSIYIVKSNGQVRLITGLTNTFGEECAIFNKWLGIMKGQYDCGIIIDNLGFVADNIIAAVPFAKDFVKARMIAVDKDTTDIGQLQRFVARVIAQ